jgi:hypothetical protein
MATPFNFTFGLLARRTLTEKAYITIANLINKHLLNRNTLLNTELVYDAFNAIDAFWLKHGQSRWYNESQIRVIIGVILQSVRDNKLSAAEVKVLSRYITTKWSPEIAQSKEVELSGKLSVELEDRVARSLKVFDKVKPEPEKIPEFVEKVSPKLSTNLPLYHIASAVAKGLKAK